MVEISQKTIVIVDDEERLLDALSVLLDSLGCDIELYKCPDVAAQRLINKPWHLLITDQSMPGLTGSDLVRMVAPFYPARPIILMTGGEMPTDVRELLAATLPKPFPPLAELRETVRRALLLGYHSQKKKVLCVDDDNDVLEVIAHLLLAQDVEVQCVNSGVAGLELAKSGNYDLVLTDYKMPDLNGTSLAQQLKLEKPDQDIVMMTAYADSTTLQAAHLVGIRKILHKPLDSGFVSKIWE